VFTRLKIIKLNEGKLSIFKLLEPTRVLKPGLCGKESKLSDHRFAIHPQQNRSAPL
jgi:hypothetical protein